MKIPVVQRSESCEHLTLGADTPQSHTTEAPAPGPSVCISSPGCPFIADKY